MNPVSRKRPAPQEALPPPANRQRRPQPLRGAASDLVEAAKTGGSRTKVLAAIFAAMADLEEDPEADRQEVLNAALGTAAGSNMHPAACAAAIKALAEAGANPNACSSGRGSDLPPLHAFIAGMRLRRHWSKGDTWAALRALLDAGTDPTCWNEEGCSPLDFACTCQNPAAVKACIPVLLAAGAGCNEANGQREPPIFSAAANAEREAAVAAIKLLLEAGADPLPGPVSALHGLAENSSAEAAGAAAAALATAITERWEAMQAAWQFDRDQAAEKEMQDAVRQQRLAFLAGERERLIDMQQKMERMFQGHMKAMHSQLQDQLKKVQNLEEEQDRARSCVVCLTAQRTTALLCGHLAMCAVCTSRSFNAAGQLQCPICRKVSSTTLTIHIP